MKGTDIDMVNRKCNKNKVLYLIMAIAVIMILWKRVDYEKAKEYEKAYEEFWQEGLYKEDFFIPKKLDTNMYI